MTDSSAGARRTIWVPRSRLARAQVPARQLSWLLEEGSLTERLVAACGEAFRVEVLAQGRERPFADEAAALALPPGRFALVREVRLVCGRDVWVRARTVIPPATLTGRERRLLYLGNRSLGATLFSDPSMTRGVAEFARLAPGQALYARISAGLSDPPPEIWGRRTVFRLADKPLLVSEYFLPAIGAYPG
jgi:chorismate--pyruvate lyase